MKKYRAAMYVRLSNSDDLKNNEESNSIINQKRLIQDFVMKQKDIEIVSEKVDDGYSGIIFERPAFTEMMDDVESGKINCVIVKDLSRFGREYIETGRYLQKVFPTYGVRFIAINDSIDTIKEDNANAGLITSFKSLINDSYCRDISVKTRSSLEIKRIKGEFLSPTARYGYIKSEENKYQLVIDEYAAQIVREIFNLKIEGYSAINIADKLNEAGVLSPFEYKKKKGFAYAKGGFGDDEESKWSSTTISRILTDEIYIGNMVQGKRTTVNYKVNSLVKKSNDEWVRVENTHEPIITNNIFELVKKILLLDTRTSPKKDSIYMFSGILICGDCGNRMTRKTVVSRGNKYIYYNCPTTKKQGCNGEMIREDDLMQCTLHSLKAHINNVIYLDEVFKEIDENLIDENKIRKRNDEISLKHDEINEINTYKATLYENMVNGILSKEEHKRFKNNYNLEIEKIRDVIKQLEKEIENIKSDECSKWISYFREFVETNELNRKMVITLIHSIVITKKNKIKINFNYTEEYEEKLNELSVIESKVI